MQNTLEQILAVLERIEAKLDTFTQADEPTPLTEEQRLRIWREFDWDNATLAVDLVYQARRERERTLKQMQDDPTTLFAAIDAHYKYPHLPQGDRAARVGIRTRDMNLTLAAAVEIGLASQTERDGFYYYELIDNAQH